MSSPPVALLWVCANGFGRLRHVRARKTSRGILVLAASFLLFALVAPVAAQFPIRQMPTRPPGGTPARLVDGPATNSRPLTAGAAAPPLPAVARIVVPEKDGISFGSGTLIDARGQFGLVVSNWHVVRDAAGPITVEFPGGFKSAAQVVKTDKDWDLAALSIYRPQVEPLPISPHAPQPGEELTIAGYGSGQWRTVAGRCTQYLAPGVEFPHEMVELAAEARQGDSGGPILNQRGELAGVLFGSGPGYTSGSYGGRVLQFLATVVPGGAPGSDGLSQTGSSLAAVDARRAPLPAELAARVPEFSPITPPPRSTALHQQEASRSAANGPYATRPDEPPTGSAAFTPALRPNRDSLLSPPPPREVADRFGTGFRSDMDEIDPRVAVVPSRLDIAPQPLASAGAFDDDSSPAALDGGLPPRASSEAVGVDLNQAAPKQLLAAVWRQFGGESPFDQAKSVLAIIGVLAIAVVFLRFGSRKEPEHHEE